MTSEPSIHLYSRRRINNIVQPIVTIIASILFLLPVSLLLTLTISDRKRLAIIVLSVVFFPLAIRPFSRPKSHELIAMTAAYVAVLVVFVEFNTA